MSTGTESVSSVVSRAAPKAFESVDDALAKLAERDGFAAVSVGGTLILQTAARQKASVAGEVTRTDAPRIGYLVRMRRTARKS